MKTVIYSKYSNERNPRLAIRTDILEDENGKRYVHKVSEFPEGQMHIADLYHWYKTFTKLCAGTKLSYNRCEIIPGGVELEYLTGETLEEHLLAVQKEKGSDACVEELLEYLNFVKELHTGAIFEPTMEFQEVFGKTELQVGTPCAPSSNIDLVCSNILLTGESWTAIDYEWSFDFTIPVNYLLYRIIFYFTDHAGRGREFKEYGLYEKMGITEEQQREFERMETCFQQYVCRNHIPVRDLYDDISEGVYKVNDTFGKQALQVYFDYGEGFSEENSVTYPMDNWEIKRTISLPEGLKALRLDPGSAAGVAELRELRFDHSDKRVAFTLREGAIVGKRLYLGDNDPNILINEIPEHAESLYMELQMYPVEEVQMEEISRIAKEYVRQKQVIREMQNTKVWKLYQKYRNSREKK